MINELVVTKISDEVFGNLLYIKNNFIELKISLDYGPRILHFSRLGMKNMFYNDRDKSTLGEKFSIYDGDIIKLYGGHRVWSSPEIMPSCYHPDNNPVEFSQKDNVFIFTAPIEKFNNIQKSITIKLTNTSSVTVTNTIKNLDTEPKTFAPWSITMLDEGGVEIMPLSKREATYLPNRFFSFWDYSNLTDNRFNIGKDFVSLTHDINNPNPFKVGFNNEVGYACYFNHKQLFIKKFEFDTNEIYPDNGCNFETYLNDLMLEMEILGGLKQVLPGEEAFIVENWSIFEETSNPNLKDEKQLNNFITPFTTGL